MAQDGNGHANRYQYESFVLPPNPHADPLTQRFAACYQWVYGTDPAWREGKICPRCSTDAAPRKWGFNDPPPAVCPACETMTIDRWPVDRIIEDMEFELGRPGAVCIIAREGEEVIGGCWGFVATHAELEAHCAFVGLARVLYTKCPGDGQFAYQDEIFVRREYQGTGVGGELFARRHARFRALPEAPAWCVLRTKRNPPSRSYLWFTRPQWGYSIVAEYGDADDRVILAQRIDRIPVRDLPPVLVPSAVAPLVHAHA